MEDEILTYLYPELYSNDADYSELDFMHITCPQESSMNYTRLTAQNTENL